MKLKQLYAPVALNTGEKGQLEAVSVYPDGHKKYFFRPGGLNKTTGKRLEAFDVMERDIDGAMADYQDYPPDIFEKDVEEINSGLKGKVIKLVYFMGGCVHAIIQPPGTKADGERKEPENIDMRSLKGEAIRELTPEEKAAAPISPVSDWLG